MAQHGINKVIIIGRVGKDPEVRSNGGATFTNLSLATSETWNDKSTGEKKEVTEWHNVSFSGKPAKIVAQYVKKGAKIYVEGKLRTRKWQDQTGQDRWTTSIVVGVDGQMQMLDSRADGQFAPQPQQSQQSQQRQQQGVWGNQAAQSGIPPMDFDDNIPF